MKQFSVIFAALCCVLLSACGGGGGGGGVSPEPPALTGQEQTELRRLTAMAAAEISEPPPLPQDLEDGFTEEVAGLQSAISSSQNTKAELERLIADLRSRIKAEKTKIAELPCDAGEERINGVCVAECLPEQVRNNNGVCEYPPCGAGEERIGGVCVAACLPEQVRNNNGVCEYPPCGAGEARIGGVCDAPCGAGQERQNGVCVDTRCGLGKISKAGQCFPLTAGDCRGIEKILVGDACRSCPAAMPRIENNSCMRELTIADCNNEDKIRVSVGGMNICRPCTAPTPTRQGNQCVLGGVTVEECNARNEILPPGEVICVSCMQYRPEKPMRVGNVCSPTVARCNENNNILDSEEHRCRSCKDPLRRVGNQCLPPEGTPLTAAHCNEYGRVLLAGATECSFCEDPTPRRDGNQCLPAMSSLTAAELRGTLPAKFAHMKARFSAVEIAVNLTNGLYYNMPLSRMFSVAPGRVSPPLGDAALKLLSSPPVAEENPRSGFFAFGDIDGEMGVRWRGKTGAFGFLPSGANMLAEASHVASDGALSGASFGALGTASGSSNGGKFRLGGRLLGGLSAFGEYEYRDISAGVSGALLDSRIRGAESSGWSAGLEYGFIGGGRMRISASRRTELSGGELVLRYPKAVGADLGDAFLGRGGQVLMEEEAALPLSRRVPLLWSLGYALSVSGKSEWSAALEYDEGADDGAISAAWRLEF